MVASAPILSDNAQIRVLIDARVAAVQAKDVAGLVAAHAPDVVMFDVIPPLAYRGVDTVRTRAAAWVAAYRGPIGYTIRDVHLTVGQDMAIAHYLYHVTGVLTSGESVAMWVRATLGLQKVEGVWTIMHDHESVPFDPATGQAALDLTPEPPGPLPAPPVPPAEWSRH